MNWGPVCLVKVVLVEVVILLVWTVGFFPLPGIASPAPMSPTVDFFQLGVELTQAEHYSQALGAFSQAILHQQHVPSAYSNRCLVQLSLGNYQGAIADCDQALATTPDNPEARLNRGLAYYHLQNYQQAIAEYDALLQQYPQEFRAYYNFSKTGGFDPTQQGYNPIRTIEPCFQRHRLGVYEA